MIKALLDYGACLEANTRHGATPVQLAVLYGHSEVVAALTAQGADISNCTAISGISALTKRESQLVAS